jgi:hypothetical protein
MRLLPLHMGAATAPSIPHALQMELLKPKLQLLANGATAPSNLLHTFPNGRMASLYNQKSSPIFSSFLIK